MFINDNGVRRQATAEEELILTSRTLLEAKRAKIGSIKQEGVTRINAEIPGITDFEQVQLLRELWLSILGAARNPTTKWQAVIDIYQAGAAGVSSVNAAATVQEVEAVVVTWP